MDDAPRSATVRAEGHGEVLRLERTRFEALLRREPGIAHAIAVALSRRIRERERAQTSDEPPQLVPVVAPAAVTSATVDQSAVTERRGARHLPVSWRCLAGGVLAGAFGVAALAAHVAAAPPQAVFALLMASAIALWTIQLLPDFAVALGLVVAWLLLGVATPAQALAGFASLTWLFVLAVLAIAGAVARSGLMFRAGLLLVRRLPSGLACQTGMLLLTGLLVSPLLPSTMGRASLTAPLALAVADARRLRDNAPAAAALGLAAWIGSTPMTFAFLNASSLCLLAWGLLPEASRARFDWIHWLVAALPLTGLVALGTIAMLFAVLRPRSGSGTTHQQLQVQLAVLGPLSRRERAMIGVLVFTVVGWLLAPLLRVDVAVVGILGLVAAVATGNLDRRALQELDWNFLVLFGVILSATGLVGGLGVDRELAGSLGARLGELRLAPWAFVALLAGRRRARGSGAGQDPDAAGSGIGADPRGGGHRRRAMGGDHHPGGRTIAVVSTRPGARLSGRPGCLRGPPVFACPVADGRARLRGGDVAGGRAQRPVLALPGPALSATRCRGRTGLIRPPC